LDVRLTGKEKDTMLRIRALNEEYNNDDEDFERTTNRKPTREAQVVNASIKLKSL